ncbi:MCE family protein [Nocardioides halotolerans]|uniref:MCE family protein n=1 Tax=Nocardioides halotolerans TaxID=433660 RepID=UPI000407BFDB|nr:MCE family protein [Nocardioides halotolerans]
MSGRREPARHELAGRGLVALVAIALLLAAVYLRSSGRWGGDPEVYADVTNAGGSLRSGSDVKLRGVIVGRVTGIGRAPDGTVRVALRLPEESLRDVPGDVVARILPATVFGTSYVDLVPPTEPGRSSLRAGAVVPADTSTDTVELQQALDDIDALVKALGPAELATTIGAAAVALHDRGERLGATAEVLDAYLRKLNPAMPLVRDDLRRLADGLEVVREVAPDLLQATDDGLVTARTIVDEQAAIEAVLAGGTGLAGDSDAFIRANGDDLARFIDNAARLVDAVYDNRRLGFTGALLTNIRVAAAVASAVEDGALQTDAVLRFDAPPYYGPADRPAYGRSR